MDLQTYLKNNNLTRPEFARRIGVSQVAVHRYINRERTPRPQQMASIVKETGGCVTPNDFLSVTSEPDAAPSDQRVAS